MPTLGAHDADLISCAVAKLWAQQLPLAGEAYDKDKADLRSRAIE